MFCVLFEIAHAGEPMGLREEGPPGVFSRAWSKGSASLDCNARTSKLEFPAFPLAPPVTELA
jgi:hypothetical protein